MEKQRHCDLILGHLKTHGSISHYEAEDMYGCTRLAARIKDLKNRGVEIEKDMVNGRNRYGQPCRYAVYRLGVAEE